MASGKKPKEKKVVRRTTKKTNAKTNVKTAKKVASKTEKKTVYASKTKNKSGVKKKVSSKANRNKNAVWPWVVGVIIVAIFAVLIYYGAPKGTNASGSTSGLGVSSPNSGLTKTTSSLKTKNSTVLAVVNGQNITMDDVDQSYLTLPETSRSNFSIASILDNLISQTLLLQQAKKQNINLTDTEFNTQLQSSLTRANMTVAELKRQLSSMGMDYNAFMKSMRTALLLQKYVKLTIVPQINVTTQQEQDFYNQNKVFMGNSTFDQVEPQIKQILVNEMLKSTLDTYIAQLKANSDITIVHPYNYELCLMDKGVTKKMIFYTSSNSSINCAPCQKMKNALNNITTDYVTVAGESTIASCFKDILTKNHNIVPELFCRDGSYLVSSANATAIKNFVNSCN